MRIKVIGFYFLLVVFSLKSGFAKDFSLGDKSLTVAVAANVQYPFEELKAEFEIQTGINIKSVIGSSGKFVAQIENGAPFDIFLSADMDYPQALQEKGLAYNTPKIYAYGALVVWTMNEVDLLKGIEALGNSNVKEIAIASPETAPYGRQAVHALKYYNLYSKVYSKLVYGENIAQTNQFITTQAVDIGITAKSVVMAPNMKDAGRWIEIEKKAYEPIAQGVVILKHAEKENLQDAQKFFDFLFSDKVREILKKYGYEF